MKFVKIDKGVKRPKKAATAVDNMEVDDSVFCDSAKERQRVASLMRTRGFKFSRYPEGSGYRLFRDE